MNLRATAALVFLAIMCTTAWGEDSPEIPTKEQIVERLKDKGTGLPRGLIMETGDPAQQDQQDAGRIDLYVGFGFNSTRLTPDGELLLDALAGALNDSDLAQYRFEVAGHTDGVGSDGYNQRLSERRANAAKDYLTARGRVSGIRLVAKGYGKTLLKNRDDPRSAENRRVEIITLGQ